MGDADDGDIEIAHLVHILQVGRLHEGVDAGEVRQLTPGEGGDVAVDDAGGRLKAEALGLINFLLPAGEGKFAFLLQCLHAFAGVRTLECPGGIRRRCHQTREWALGRSPGLLSLRVPAKPAEISWTSHPEGSEP